MKKAFLPIVLGLALVSCRDTGGVDNLPEEPPILPVKMVGGEDGDVEYKYEGDKLVEFITTDEHETTRSLVEYTGDFITTIREYSGGKEVGKTTFEYENGKLVREVEVGSNSLGQTFTERMTFTYNSDGTITQTINGGNEYIITIANGNYMKDVHRGETRTYTYDTKNSPFKNVKGLSALVVQGAYFSNANNLTGEVVELNNGVRTVAYTYEYNTNNFPTKQMRKNSNDANIYTTTYTYNK